MNILIPKYSINILPGYNQEGSDPGLKALAD
jgi:hypothetical protein